MNTKPWNSRLWFLLIPVAFAAGWVLNAGSGSSGPKVPVEEAAAPVRWTCSMHPQIILPSNDQMCPICAMDLIALEDSGDSDLGANEMSLSPEAAALADVGTSRVRRRFVARQVPLVGKVSADETRLKKITARFGGRIDRLHLATTGQTVTRGMPLAEIYSPELYSAQQELQTAVQALPNPGDLGYERASRLVDASRRKLLLLGLSEEKIDGIAAGQLVGEHLSLQADFDGVVTKRLATEGQYVQTGSVLFEVADLSTVWLTLQAFERDLPWLRSGQTVAFHTRSHPGRVFSGEIVFLDQILNEKTRTVEVRVLVDNGDGALKPGLLVSAEVESVLGADGQPVSGDQVAEAPLVVPASAPLLTGRRAVVYVRLPGHEEPVYQGRSVSLGPKAGDFYLVNDGLSEGEEVVTRGGFKIDSALQIQARPSMMQPGRKSGNPIDPEQDHPTLAVTEEFHHGLSELLVAYLILQNTLANDDDAGSRAAALEVEAALVEVESRASGLPVASALQWNGLSDGLANSIQALVRSRDLESRRLPFQPLSDTLWLVVESFGAPGTEAVRRFNCPMAMDGAGADWLQTDKQIANPYFGDMMLRCGSEVAIHE